MLWGVYYGRQLAKVLQKMLLVVRLCAKFGTHEHGTLQFAENHESQRHRLLATLFPARTAPFIGTDSGIYI